MYAPRGFLRVITILTLVLALTAAMSPRASAEDDPPSNDPSTAGAPLASDATTTETTDTPTDSPAEPPTDVPAEPPADPPAGEDTAEPPVESPVDVPPAEAPPTDPPAEQPPASDDPVSSPDDAESPEAPASPCPAEESAESPCEGAAAPDGEAPPAVDAPTGEAPAEETDDAEAPPVASPTATDDAAASPSPSPNARLAVAAEPATLRLRSTTAGSGTTVNACYVIFRNNGGGQGQFVANPCADQSGFAVASLDAGSYYVLVTPPPGFLAGQSQIVTLSGGEDRALTFVLQTGGQSVTITARDTGGNPVLNACFNINADEGESNFQRFVAGNCDGNGGAPDGTTVVGNLPPGAYTVTNGLPPAGYTRPALQRFAITAGGGGAAVTVIFGIATEAVETLTVNKVDGNGAPLTGACFNIYLPDNTGGIGSFVTSGCNFEGSTLTFDLEPGEYILLETFPPNGYVVGGRTAFTIVAGEDLTLNIVNTPGGQALTIRKTDASGAPLGGACFGIYTAAAGGGIGAFVVANCDGPQDGPFDGATFIPGLMPGNYIARENITPDGFVQSADTPFSIVAGQDLTLFVKNLPFGPGPSPTPSPSPSPTPDPSPSPAPQKPPADPDDHPGSKAGGSTNSGASTVTALPDTGSGIGSLATSGGTTPIWIFAALLTALAGWSGWAVRVHGRPSR